MKPSVVNKESSLLIKPIMAQVEDVDQEHEIKEQVAETTILPKTIDDIISDAAA